MIRAHRHIPLRASALLLLAATWTLALAAGENGRLDVVLPISRPLADPYKILLTRSIFARDHRPAPVYGSGAGAPPSTSTSPSTLPYSPGSNPQLSDEEWVLTGTTQTDAAWEAMFENAADHSIRRVHPNDAFSRGRVMRVEIGAVDFIGGRGVIHVLKGQNLRGELHALTSASTAAPPPPAPGAGAFAPGPGSGGFTGGSDGAGAPASPGSTPSPAGDRPKWWHSSK